MNVLLAPSILTDGIKLQSLSEVITLNDKTLVPTFNDVGVIGLFIMISLVSKNAVLKDR